MPPNPYRFVLATGLKVTRRAIGFLECTTDGALDAKQTFDGLKEKKKMLVNNRFTLWLDGKHHDKYFHGWPNDQVYKICFVFKWDERRVGQRLYGFLCHPKPKSDMGFQLCVLVCHATKTEWETDDAELDRVVALSFLPEVRAAIRQTYPEY